MNDVQIVLTAIPLLIAAIAGVGYILLRRSHRREAAAVRAEREVLARK